MSVDHLKSGGVQTESMQTPDRLRVDDHEIHSLSCMIRGVHPESRYSSGVHLESNQSVWRSVKYTMLMGLQVLDLLSCSYCGPWPWSFRLQQ